MADLFALHDLVEPADDEPDVTGTRCDTEWCNAFRDARAECGDVHGPYAGLVHKNRIERAAGRIKDEDDETEVEREEGR